MTTVTFTVPGQPRPKERARVTRRGSGKRAKVVTYTPPRTRAYEDTVYTAALLAVSRLPGGRWSWPRDAWYWVDVELFYGDRKIADADNVQKAILDGCHDVLWLNDKRAIDVSACVAEVCSPEPRAVVTVTVVDPPVGWAKAPKRRKHIVTFDPPVIDERGSGEPGETLVITRRACGPRVIDVAPLRRRKGGV